MNGSRRGSFDHLVGPAEQRKREANAKCFGSVEIDYKIEFYHLLNWQVPRLGTFQNSAGVVANLPIALYFGMKIGQISFFKMSSPVDRPYGSPGLGSKYQGQSEPTASAFHRDASGPQPDKTVR